MVEYNYALSFGEPTKLDSDFKQPQGIAVPPKKKDEPEEQTWKETFSDILSGYFGDDTEKAKDIFKSSDNFGLPSEEYIDEVLEKLKSVDTSPVEDDILKDYDNLNVREDSFDVMSFTPQGVVLKIEEPDADQEKMDAKYIRINTNPPTADEVQPPDGKDPFHPNSFTQKHLEKVEAGGYNTLFGNAEKTSKEFKDVKITDMSIGELVEFTKPSGPYGKWVKPRLPEDTEAHQKGLTSTPLGKYQIVGTTLRKLVKDYGWSLEDKFTKKVQDRMFLQLAYEALDNKESMGEKVKSMRKVWEGLREGKGSTEQDVIKIIKEIESTRLSRSPFPRRKPAGIMERPPL